MKYHYFISTIICGFIIILISKIRLNTIIKSLSEKLQLLYFQVFRKLQLQAIFIGAIIYVIYLISMINQIDFFKSFQIIILTIILLRILMDRIIYKKIIANADNLSVLKKKYILNQFLFLTGIIVVFLGMYFLFDKLFATNMNMNNNNNKFESRLLKEYPKHKEAMQWLENNKNLSALASNRFGYTLTAKKFVENLYNLGAEKVYVVNITEDSETIKDEGGPYADALVVILPDSYEQKKKIVEISLDEAIREGFGELKNRDLELEKEMKKNPKETFMWWD